MQLFRKDHQKTSIHLSAVWIINKHHLIIWKEEDNVMVNTVQYRGFYYGLCVLKAIIQESHLDTNMITSMIITKIYNLDIYIHTMGNKITKFNAYIIHIIGTSASWGETTQCIIINHFKGYGANTEKSLLKFIQRKRNPTIKEKIPPPTNSWNWPT